MIERIIAFLPFYLLGTIPNGVIIAKLKGIDVTAAGSGNVGATNVARVVGKSAGLLTLILDVLKGLLAVSIAYALTNNNQFAAWSLFAVVAGHCFSIPGWLKGGKGVATSLGAILALDLQLASAAIAGFILIFAMTRIVSIASISAALILPIVAMFTLNSDRQLLPISLASLLVVFRHRQNISRFILGKEAKFSFSSNQK